MIRGVVSVVPGYAGGTTPNPTYEQVCSGATGHAEVVKVVFNPEKVSYQELLEVFFATHDPTTPNRQGADVGTQYRSVILYSSEAQKLSAERFISSLNTALVKSSARVVTQVAPLTAFYPAEDYHHNYFAKNPNQAYCQGVISPKVEKAKKELKRILKNHESEGHP